MRQKNLSPDVGGKIEADPQVGYNKKMFLTDHQKLKGVPQKGLVTVSSSVRECISKHAKLGRF